MVGKRKSGTVTLEALFERIEALDASNSSRFEKIESALNKKSKNQLDQAVRRETVIE
jgi:hypothetical protein